MAGLVVGAVCAKEHGCGIENNTSGVIVLVLLGAGFVFCFLLWLQFRWNRGPLAWYIRRRLGEHGGAKSPKSEGPFGG